MIGWSRGLLERLSYRLMSVVSAKLEAQLQLEIAEVQAALHERAAEYQGSLTEGGTSIATPLLELSERLGSIDNGTSERLEQEGLSQQSSDPSNNASLRRTKGQASSSDCLGDRKRGRPRKVVEDAAPHPMDETLLMMNSVEEVT